MAPETLAISRATPAPGEMPRGAVSAAFQVRFLLKFGLTVVCGAVLAGAAAYALLAKDLNTYSDNITIIHNVRKTVFGVAVLSALIQLGLSGLVVMAVALLTSHKIVGPTVRLVRLLRGVREGRLPGLVRFRAGDQAAPLEAHFNEVSCLLSERHDHIRREVERVRSAKEELELALRNSSFRDESRLAAARLRERADGLARCLATFRSEAGRDS